ncbi:zinc-dependent metalloprotease [Thalassotalea ponticola]|uniref:zinc-dependent metalloprotease n=1 Tax=Thalassotalea ponticola TaxID=1523392 RepID=UPI0025B39BD7|nr:zinc-dependent metalloprotease [Thalassotalea ponticola]MDN3652060.1 zinc-dependent metalloprotease [Thalassotalea ponticola]
MACTNNLRVGILLLTLLLPFQLFASFADNKSFVDGFMPLYIDQTDGKVYVQINDFNSPFLFQSSLPHGVGSNDIGLDRGQLGTTRLVQFERVGNKVFLRQLNTDYRADSANPLERQAVEEAFASSIIWGFSLVDTGETGSETRYVIDYTDFLLSDIHNLGATLRATEQGNFKIDTSRSGLYQPRTKAFVDNTELEATITFVGTGTGKHLKSVTPDANAISVHMHHSLIRLPDDQYQVREFHPFSGMWSLAYADYASAIDEPLVKRIIPRHRLAKKDPEAKVSEAVEPIVYYLDPGVPEPIRSALIDGALWWNQAFEQIGYKNAFQVKMLPADADPMDVRYNVIQWVHRATRGWSYGASVVDPRTGEIIKGHVTLGSLRVRQDYLIALGLTSPFSESGADTSAQQQMALARIRQLSAHEVGHTLGIAHNFSASVNNRASVMDYPHPLVKIDRLGNIDLSDAYDDQIGIWDKHVIHYAYGDNNDRASLLSIVAQAKARGLKYTSDPDARPQSGADAHGHLWDNGEDPVVELQRVTQIRDNALAKLGVNSIAMGTPYSELENVLVPIYNFHRYQVEATVKLIAGLEYSYAIKGEDQVPFQRIAGAKQSRAIDALLATLSASFLTMPEHIVDLIPPKAYGYSRDRESFVSNTGIAFDPVSAAEASAKHTLALLLNRVRLSRLYQQNLMDSSVPSLGELFQRLFEATIEQSVGSGLSIAVQQRVNQQVIDTLIALYHDNRLVTEVRSATYLALLDVQSWLKQQLKTTQRSHPLYGQYALMRKQINFSLQLGNAVITHQSADLPPGSPIGMTGK